VRFDIQVTSKVRSDFVDITSQIQECVRSSGVQDGLCLVVVPHTTAGLTVNENWDPSVRSDMMNALDRLVPWRAMYEHSEGNAAAHIKASLLGCSQTLLVQGGQLALGTWQGIFLAEFDGPRQRQVWVRVMADVERP